VVLQWERADALAGRREDCVEHRGCGDADRRLADATPETAGWHDDRFDLGHLRDAHRVVTVEVRLLDTIVLDRAFLVEQGGEAKDEGPRGTRCFAALPSSATLPILIKKIHMTMKTIRIKESFEINGGRLSSKIQQFRPMPFAGTAACQRTASRGERHAPMARMALDVNGKVQTIDTDPDMPLLYAFRNEFRLK
jgi:hypothetical protein